MEGQSQNAMRHTITFSILISLSHLLQAQTVTDSILVDKQYRTFHYNKPKNLNTPALVFVLHGSGGNGKGQMKQTLKLEEIAAKENFLVVYPDGYKKYWNECRKASPAEANKENINEEGFFIGMIAYFKKKFNADDAKVFALGTSGGGHMAYKLALTIPDKIKAITAIIANLPDTTNFDCAPVNKPIPVMIINGTEDKINPYNGGEVNIGFSLGFVRSTDNSFRYWASLAGHHGKPVKEVLPDTDPTDGKRIERYSYVEKGKPDVVLLKVIGGKHDYPNDINVFIEAWQFFKTSMSRH
jgi:polyhydroxybutyrate depolymerase